MVYSIAHAIYNEMICTSSTLFMKVGYNFRGIHVQAIPYFYLWMATKSWGNAASW